MTSEPDAIDAVAQIVRMNRSVAAGDVAEHILETLHTLGYRRIPTDCCVVPKEPTRAMLDAAAAAMSPGKRPTPNRVSVAKKHAIRYRAMIAAGEGEA